MNIIEIIIRSFGESLKPKRFVPFFLLYLIFSAVVLIFFNSLLQILPSVILSNSSEKENATFMFNMFALLATVIIFGLVSIWFNSALIFDVYKKKGFNSSLKYSKKVYLKVLFFHIIIILLLGVLTSMIGGLGFIMMLAIDWILMFSMISLVIKEDSVQEAMIRSYSIVRKNLLNTLVFFILTIFIVFVIMFICIILTTFSMFPIFKAISEAVPDFNNSGTLSSEQIAIVIYAVLPNFPSFVIASIIASLFLSFANVFILTSKTYYFLSFKKK